MLNEVDAASLRQKIAAVKPPGKILIMGFIGTNFPLEWRKDPRLVLWDNQHDLQSRLKRIPKGVRLILQTRFVKFHVKEALRELLPLDVEYVPHPISTGMMKKFLAPVMVHETGRPDVPWNRHPHANPEEIRAFVVKNIDLERPPDDQLNHLHRLAHRKGVWTSREALIGEMRTYAVSERVKRAQEQLKADVDAAVVDREVASAPVPEPVPSAPPPVVEKPVVQEPEPAEEEVIEAAIPVESANGNGSGHLPLRLLNGRKLGTGKVSAFVLEYGHPTKDLSAEATRLADIAKVKELGYSRHTIYCALRRLSRAGAVRSPEPIPEVDPKSLKAPRELQSFSEYLELMRHEADEVLFEYRRLQEENRALRARIAKIEFLERVYLARIGEGVVAPPEVDVSSRPSLGDA